MNTRNHGWCLDGRTGEEEAKPHLEMAVADGWFTAEGFLEGASSQLYDCPRTTCRYTVTSDKSVDSSHYDGYLDYYYSSGPSAVRSNTTKPWFLTGYMMYEPELE